MGFPSAGAVSALSSRPPPSAPKPAVLDLAAAARMQDSEGESLVCLRTHPLLYIPTLQQQCRCEGRCEGVPIATADVPKLGVADHSRLPDARWRRECAGQIVFVPVENACGGMFAKHGP